MQDFNNPINRGKPLQILNGAIPISEYCVIDLSDSNEELQAVNISNPEECQSYIEKVLTKNKAKVAYGGYLEHRELYSASNLFAGKEKRNIHLGIDFWCSTGTKVVTPLDGKVHSFANNSTIGDYGPTIILEHENQGFTFYTLYGHLSVESLSGLFVGKEFKKGQPLATLGETKINVNYAPHLHFQLIMDIENHFGDYPGVCSTSDLKFFKQNCPDPNFLLQL